MLVKGIIFAMMASGQEMPIPATHYFTSVEECEKIATENLSKIMAVTGGTNILFTCEVVAE